VSGIVDWDAATYDRVSDPQREWGREVLARLELAGDETVLDAGCGSGRVTGLVLERLPGGRVIGVDSSESMVELARRNLESYGDRAELILGDLLELELPQPVDAIFSNATFHWIAEHELLFSRLHAALRPGGVLEAQCGGEGNIAQWQRAVDANNGDERFAPYLRGMPPATNFASVGNTELRLERAGFEEVRVWLEDREVTPREPKAFVSAVVLAKHLARLPEELREPYVDAVLGMMPRPAVLRYVRLNMSARRPG
jgi:trans-aconitate 2-methyltransferase